MSRRDLLIKFGWNDELIDFFMVSEEEDTKQNDENVYTYDEEDTSTLLLSSSFSSNVLQISR